MQKIRIILILLFAVAGIFSLAKISQAASYYVSTSGNDSNLGTQSSPWLTIQKAANTMVAGDTVIVDAGTYNERINVSRSGTSDSSRITFSASGTVNTYGFYVTGNYVTINGFTVTAQVCSWGQDAVGIYISGDHCVIENNYAYYSPRGGILLNPASSNCTVKNNRAYRNGMDGLDISGANHLVENNEIWGSIAYHTPTGCTGDADGLRFFGSGHTIRGNYIHDININDPENSGYGPHIDCFQTWAASGLQIATNIVFEKNKCENRNLMMYAGMIEGSSYLTFKNNIFIGYAGLNVNPSMGANDHLIFVNNTCIGDTSILNCTVGSNCWPVGIALNNAPYSTVKNNIFYDFRYMAYSIEGSSETGLDAGYNLTYRSDGITPSGTRRPNDLWGVDPKLVNPAQKDFHLQSTSPAIDAGASISGVIGDYDGNSRPQGAGYDIGAYEYVGALLDTTPPSTPTNLTATAISSTQINLSWSASTDNVGVTGYRLERCQGSGCSSFTQIGTLTGTSYSDTGLSVSTAYSYRVRAIDAVGNLSSYSSTASVTTQATGVSSLVNSSTMTSNSGNLNANEPITNLWDGCTDALDDCMTGNSGIDSFWVEFDFGQSYNLASARLFGDADNTWWSSTWQLEYKLNQGDSWTTAFSGVNAFTNSWVEQNLTGKTARYAKVTVFGNSTDHATEARELEIFGTLASDTTPPAPPSGVTVN